MNPLAAIAFLYVFTTTYTATFAEELPWPPRMKGVENGRVTFSSPRLLEVPAEVRKVASDPKSVPFDVAAKPPTVDLAFHEGLGPNAAERRLWSSWGDICVASDGRVYVAIGDHGNDVGGDARCFIYRWDPASKRLEQVVDMNKVEPPKAGRPSWSKVHAKIDEGSDGYIYFSCTLNAGDKAKLPSYHFDDEFPGGRLYRFDPKSGKTEVFANLPPRRCTATSRLDRERNIWWCNLEAGEGNALFGLDLATRKPVFQAKDGSTGFNRAFALLNDGSILVNGPTGLLRHDPGADGLKATKSTFSNSPGMRCASEPLADGSIFGVTQTTHELFSYDPARDELKTLGPCFLTGSYTTVMVASPDSKYLYYLPGAHGSARLWGTPVVRYERSTGKQTVLAFLGPYCEREFGYVPSGTYGMKISRDGRTLYVNFNGHSTLRERPKHLRENGFGLTSLAAIHLAD